LTKSQVSRRNFRQVRLLKLKIQHDRDRPVVALPQQREKIGLGPLGQVGHRAAHRGVGSVDNELAGRTYAAFGGRGVKHVPDEESRYEDRSAHRH
jgi:hypothetical protein